MKTKCRSCKHFMGQDNYGGTCRLMPPQIHTGGVINSDNNINEIYSSPAYPYFGKENGSCSYFENKIKISSDYYIESDGVTVKERSLGKLGFTKEE